MRLRCPAQWGPYSAPTDPLAGLQGWEGRERMEKEGGNARNEGGEGKGRRVKGGEANPLAKVWLRARAVYVLGRFRHVCSACVCARACVVSGQYSVSGQLLTSINICPNLCEKLQL